MAHKFPKILFWILPALLITCGLVTIFSHIYDSTQKLRSAAQMERYPDINLGIVEPVSKMMEVVANEVSSHQKQQQLSESQILQRKKRVEALSKQFPKAHLFYTHQCASCHGHVGEGGKALYSLTTRMSHENIAYRVPLLKTGPWSSNLDIFRAASSKEDSPHLPPTGVENLTKEALIELQQYLKQLCD